MGLVSFLLLCRLLCFSGQIEFLWISLFPVFLLEAALGPYDKSFQGPWLSG